jgi:hypothetical protein
MRGENQRVDGVEGSSVTSIGSQTGRRRGRVQPSTSSHNRLAEINVEMFWEVIFWGVGLHV